MTRRALLATSLSVTALALWSALPAHAAGTGSATTNVMRRLQAGQWQSPVVTAMLMRYYAEQTLGSHWSRLDPAQIGTAPALA